MIGARPIPPVRRRASAGFTLVEAVLSIVLVSAVLVAALGAVGAATAARRRTEPQALGALLAQELMIEILEQAYEDPEASGAALGYDSGEWTGTRSQYDDVDDYYWWSESPPQDRSGALRTELTGWEREVDIALADPADVSTNSGPDQGIKRIRVTVSYQGAVVAALTSLRTAGWPSRSEPDPILLLVVADASSPTAQDLERETLLESWGFAVTMISATQSEASFDAAVAGAAVAYVVEQQQSTALGTKLRDAAIGVVCEEAELRADFGFASNRDWPTPTTGFEVLDGTHYITQPFATGDLAIAAANVEVVAIGGQRAPDLIALGHILHTGTNMPVLSIIETDGLLYGGGAAPARRVQLPWGRTGFDINDLNDDGRTLMQRAVEWVAEMEEP